MRIPTWGARLLILALCLLALGAGAWKWETAHAASPPPVHALHVGMHGKRVKALQWLLSGHRPSARRIVSYHGKVNGRYTRGTAHAVRNMKYILGYPSYQVNGLAGPMLFHILKGERRLNEAFHIRRTARLAALKRMEAERARTSCQRNVLSAARGELGVSEHPWGSNSGVRVREYQRVTGAYYAPWCVSFIQWVYRQARVHSPHAWSGAIGNNTAGAFYLAGWARYHGWLRSVPHPAYIVVFLDRLGHVGIVESTTAHGFYSIEGNADNSVLRRYHPYGARPEVFVRVPGCDGT